MTAREMVNEEKDDNDDKDLEDNFNHSVCQIVKVRVFDNHHACSSCHSEDCSSVEISMFKQVSIFSVSISPSSSCSSIRLSHPPPFTTSIGGILTLVLLVIFSYLSLAGTVLLISVLPVR